MQVPLDALLGTFGASLAAARLHDLVLPQGAPLFVVHSFVVVCRCPWVPSCTFGASLAAARLHDLVLPQGAPLFIVHSLCCCMQVPLGALLPFWRLTCSCATARSRPEQGAPLFVVHSFVVVCRSPWVPSCTFGASLAAARLHDLVHFRATVGGLAQVMLLYAAKQHTYVIFLIFFLDLPA